MALDPVIAGGFRGVELQNPLEAYGRVAQLQHLQQQNALAALQMQKAQQDIKNENRLAQLYQQPGVEPTSPEFMRQVYAISPLKGAAFQKSALEIQKAQRESDAAAEKLANDRIAGARALLPGVTADTWAAWRADTLRKLPGLASMIPETYSDEAKLRMMQNADQYLAERKPMAVAAGASVYRPGETAPMYTAPAAPSPLAKLVAEREALAPGDPRRATYDAAIKKATTHQEPPKVDVKVAAYTPASEAAQRDYIGSVSKERDALRNAPDTLANVDKARSLIPGAKGFMGAGGEPLLKASSFLNNRLGFNIDTKGVADATELRTRLFEGIMDNLKRLDSQPSQEQQRIMQEALGTLGTDPNALPRVLDKIEETVRGRVLRYNEDVTDAEGRGVKFPFKPQIKLPERKAAPAEPSAIPGAAPVTATPAGMAPMYARNPTTGARIMSTDGGNTWVPAR